LAQKAVSIGMHTASQMSSLTGKACSPRLLSPRSRRILGVGSFTAILSLATIGVVLAGIHGLGMFGDVRGITVSATSVGHWGAAQLNFVHFVMYSQAEKFTDAS
jgi:hypothetical protein